ncbi:MAG: hypothetical protein K0U84_13405 [Actinomycetia bacterium]|nr:hypothetical protein [Actinomycetes bacterium]
MPTFADCFANVSGSIGRDMFDAIRTAPDPTRAVLERRAQLALAKRQKGLQAVALHRARQQIGKHSRGIDSGLAALLTRDIWGEGTGLNIEFKARAIMAQSYGEWEQGLSKFRSKAAGLKQDHEGLRNLVRELGGEDTGDPTVRALAGGLEDIYEKLRSRFNRAGGAIGKIDRYIAPQYHDALRVRRFGEGTLEQKREAWKQFIRPLLDRERMRDALGRPLSDSELNLSMDAAYDRIVTGGLSDLQPGASGGKKLANQRADHRFFIFRDGDAWLKYHDQFGRQDLYSTLTDHVMSMSHDIALLETLGPNPEAGFRYLRDLVRKAYAPGGALEVEKGAHTTRLQYLDSLWNVVSGKTGRSPNPQLADLSNSVRHILVGAKLGGAFLSALSDTTFQALTRKFNGLPVWGMVRRQLSQMNPANEADRAFAVHMGLGADAWLNHSMVANRFSDVWGANMASKISDFTMRASLLSSWTDAGQKAFGLDFTRFMAQHRRATWAQLRNRRDTRAFRQALTRGGITEQDWNRFRGLDPLNYRGAEYLRPQDIVEQAQRLGISERAANDLTAKFLGVIHEEMNFAVPTPDARVRAITTMGAQSGTVPGELARHLFLFKSFPLTVITQNFYRGLYQEGGLSKAAYVGMGLIGTTVMGAVALQAKELSRGKDPRPMDDPKFLAAALYQGGGAGIVGDFLFSPESRFGQDPLTTFLGPTVGLGGDFLNLTVDNAKAALGGEDAHFASDLAGFAERYTPGSSIWYARLALERLVFDQLDMMADKGKARKAWRRMMRKRQKEYRQGFWWRPGQAEPSRAPKVAD